MPKYAGSRVPISQVNLNGGLNDTAGPLSLKDNESSDLLNVDFDKFGSVLTRNGYLNLISTALTSTPDIDGLWWYQSNSLEKLICVAGDKVYKMDDLDGTFDDITGALTITAGNACDFDNFLNTVLVTNGVNPPFSWSGAGNAAAMTVPTGLTTAKFVKQYENYCILANVTVSATAYPSRWYWSTIKTIDTWNSADFIEVEKDDGQEITGCKVLGDALIIFKERKIIKYIFTGERDIPFIGKRTASAVGCVAPGSIQEVDNGLVFLSYDGLYYFDGNTSYKISDRINNTILGLSRSQVDNARSLVQKDKNRYWLAVTSSGQAENDKVIVWDYFNNAMTIYDGMAISALTTVYVDGEERPYFGDYAGWVYRADTGNDDYPLSVQTKITSYYYTNWRHFGDIVDQKGVPHIYIYHQYSNSVLTLYYSYDFESVSTYSQTFSLSAGGDVYGTGVYGTAVYGGSGGNVLRRDLAGMGRVVRFGFETDTIGERFQIDGIGTMVNMETFS